MNADDLIYLTPYLPQWADMAALEIKQIKNILQDLDIEKIEHIGSTAVPGLASKPVIDIAIKVGRIENGKDAIRPLESFGYLYLAENSDEKHMFFVKGLPPHGDGRTHHLHFYERDWFDRHT
ncbi:MAG: GrpB family protein, partial [Bdellovibrionales bacterium]|nr:GrpB family protein [Bdellovibrionales bacterium]